MFVCTLPSGVQDALRDALLSLLSSEDAERAMQGRVCDLYDTLDKSELLCIVAGHRKSEV